MIPAARRTLIASLVAAVFAIAPAASAALSDETALAERYAPVVRLVTQHEPCGPGEPYEPIDVDLLFGDPTVALRGPWSGTDLVKIGPAAGDLAKSLYEYHLDFPGSALDPGCGYEKWARRLTQGHGPAVYADVAQERLHPDKLSLQYWLYYPFNDWNNTHEGDWEMIQLVFDAPDAATALRRRPAEVGYSQHEGAERGVWGEDKLELVGGTHPVVHPAAGSHANFFEEALYIGSSASEGVGCDNTLGPTHDLRPVVKTIPSDAAAAGSAFPWIGFEGRWGELQRAFFNGPTGPNLKGQWTEPIRWSEDWRDRSLAVPAGGTFGTSSTDFFCGAVAAGSNAIRRAVENPTLALAVLGALLVIVVWLLTRTTWRPTAPLRIARRRAWGQIIISAGRMYRARWRLFLGIGLVALPISLLVTVLQLTLFNASQFVGVDTEAESTGILVMLGLLLGTTLTLLGFGFVQAATLRALVEVDEGRTVGPVRAYRLALDSIRPLLGALLIAVAVVSVLLSSLLLVPFAIWLAVRWALIVPVVELEGHSTLGALRRSGRLVRQEWLKVALVVIVGGGLALLAGPLIGALLILATSAPLALLNIVAGIVYAVTMPFVALATAYVYFDTRVQEQLAVEKPAELPAEISLG